MVCHPSWWLDCSVWFCSTMLVGAVGLVLTGSSYFYYSYGSGGTKSNYIQPPYPALIWSVATEANLLLLPVSRSYDLPSTLRDGSLVDLRNPLEGPSDTHKHNIIIGKHHNSPRPRYYTLEHRSLFFRPLNTR